MRTPKNLTLVVALAFASLAAFPLQAFAAHSTPHSSGLNPRFDDDEEEAEAEEEEDKDEYVAIVGGDVHTGTGAVLRGATIFGKNGKIVEIGYDLWMPEETELIDARGMSVYPGLVALNATSRIARGLFAAEFSAEDVEYDSHYGLDDGHVRRPGDEAGELEHEHHAEGESSRPEDVLLGGTEPVAAAASGALSRREQARVKAEDEYDPFSEYLVLALAAGVTTADQSGVATKLRRDTFKGTFLNDDMQTRMSWNARSPQSITALREKFAKASEYLRLYRAWEERGDKEEKEPSKSGVDSNVVRVLKGEVLARFNSDSRQDLLGIARLAQRYNFRPLIWGCREGWTVADELGRAGAFAVVTPRERRPKPENLVRPGGSSIENAAKLHAAGVQVAIVTANSSFDLSGMTGRDLSNLPLEAGFAIRGGLPDDAAFAAITSLPARLMGIEHRVGTLEVGKDFDALICDGDIMHYETFVQVAVVEGKVAYDKSEEIFYAHIRPRPELPPLDPGELLEGGTGVEIEEEVAPAEEDDAQPEEGEEQAEESEQGSGDDAGGDEGGDGGEDDGAGH